MLVDKNLLKNIGEHIQKARILRRLTHQELADRALITRQTIAKIERGGSTTTSNFIKVIWALSLDDALINSIAPENDSLGRSLAFGRLPKRVKKPSPDNENGEF